jgi:DNA-binding transcriptional LysR family regulator
MMLDDMNDLRLFAAVVANGGFSAAARSLAVPKSRVSRRITALEDQLGVRLLERSTRRFSVTEIGQEVYQHARAVMAEAETIVDAAARLKSEPQGLVRISVPLGPDKLIGSALPRFLAEHPKIRIQMVVTNRRIDLIDEGIDIAVRVRERLDTDPDLQLKTIGSTVGRLVASPALLDELGRPASLEDLKRYPTLAHSEQPGTDRWHLVGPDGREASFTHEPRLAATDLAILHQAALDGVGVAFLPELHFRLTAAEGRIEVILPEWSSRDAIIHLVYTSRRGLLPSVRVAIDFVANVLRPCSEEWSR